MSSIHAPNDLPEVYKADVQTLSESARNVMDFFQWPYSVQAVMAQNGYLTLADLADRWDDPTIARAAAMDELKFDGQWSDSDKSRIAMKVMQAVRRAKSLVIEEAATSSVVPGTPIKSTAHTVIQLQNRRSSMEAEWRKRTGVKPPPLDEQPSDNMIKIQWANCEIGTYGTCETNKIVSALPLPSDKMNPLKKRKVDSITGHVMEFEEEQGRWPSEKRE